MRTSPASLLIGTVFRVGLTVCWMINSAEVIGFLDFAGDWDPTLAVVMAAALAVATSGFAMVRRRRRLRCRVGVAGFRPGPVIAAVTTGLWPVLVFVAAMSVGMWPYRRLPGGSTARSVNMKTLETAGF